MKTSTSASLSVAVAVVGLAASANAQPLFTFGFDTDAQGFNGGAWSSTFQAVQQNKTAGGWTLGSSIVHEFDWASGQQVPMQNLAAAGTGRLSLDLFVDGSSFSAGAACWYQVHLAGNSSGSVGWTQYQAIDGWHNADDAALYSTHVDLAFADVGWQPGDTWFQLCLGSNSEAARTANFYVDNVNIYAIPEPGTFTMIGLGLATLLVLRRRW